MRSPGRVDEVLVVRFVAGGGGVSGGAAAWAGDGADGWGLTASLSDFLKFESILSHLSTRAVRRVHDERNRYRTRL